MHFSDTLSSVEKAKEAFFKAENERHDWKRKVDLYMVASKHYLSAATIIVGDNATVQALVFLSSSALFKADLANSMVRTCVSDRDKDDDAAVAGSSASLDSSASKKLNMKSGIDDDAESIGQSSLSGRVLLMANSGVDRRSTMGSSSKMRSSGLMGVPKAGAVAPSDAAYDLFFLEKKLAELGLMTGNSSSSYRNNTSTSALGESFMLLSTSSSRGKFGKASLAGKNVLIPFGTRDSLRAATPECSRIETVSVVQKNEQVVEKETFNSSNAPTPYSSVAAPTPPAVPVSGPYGGMVKKKIPIAPKPAVGVNKTIGTFWLPNPIDILTWRGPKPSSPTLDYLEVLQKKPGKEFSLEDSHQFDIHWNDDQSVYGSAAQAQAQRKREGSRRSQSSDNLLSALAIQEYFNASQGSTEAGTGEDKEGESDRREGTADSAEQNSNSGYIDNGTVRESELRLLQSIKRLGDENFSLLQRIELLSTVEAKNLDMHREMSSFKKEYQERFCKLKEVLREFQRKNSKDGNPRTFGFEFNTVIGTQPGDIFDGKPNQEDVKNSAGDKESKSLGASRDGSGADEQGELRQQQLERAVLALVKRLEESKTELDKRDRLIGKYEKYYRQLKRDAERRETERRGGAPSSENEKNSLAVSSSPSSSASKSSASPTSSSTATTPPLPPPSGKSSQNTSVSSNSSLGGSNSAQRQPPRGPSMVQARNKHPSISTLETTLGLQRDRAGIAGSGSRYTHTGGGVYK